MPQIRIALCLANASRWRCLFLGFGPTRAVSS
jgi:hypothetical protein